MNKILIQATLNGQLLECKQASDQLEIHCMTSGGSSTNTRSWCNSVKASAGEPYVSQQKWVVGVRRALTWFGIIGDAKMVMRTITKSH